MEDLKENIIQSYFHSMQESNSFIAPMMKEVGFVKIAKLKHIKIEYNLVTTLVERWRTGMHIFHLPTSECTITL